MQAVQLVLGDPVYAAGLRDALTRTGPWSIDFRDAPDPSRCCVLVVDEDAFDRMARPLPHPERVVLITRMDPPHLSDAWDAGIVSVLSEQDPPGTVLLAIMAAALRVSRLLAVSPAHAASSAPEPGGSIAPAGKGSRLKSLKHN
jgi:hypothetical protein